MTHTEQCYVKAFSYANYLIKAIEAKLMNAGAFEGCMESYLNVPAFSSNREILLKEVIKYFKEKEIT